MNFKGSELVSGATSRESQLPGGLDGLPGAGAVVLREAEVIVAAEVDALLLPALNHLERPVVVI